MHTKTKTNTEPPKQWDVHKTINQQQQQNHRRKTTDSSISHQGASMHFTGANFSP